jgi:uncharacterized protein (TIGR00255 family)
MTGYGQAHRQGEGLAISIELRALNNRYLKVSLRAAEPYNALEPEVDKLVRRVIRRGTIQVHLHVERPPTSTDYRINETAFRAYWQQLRTLAADSSRPIAAESCLAQILALPGVVADPAGLHRDLAEDWPVLEAVLGDAMERLQLMRQEEGRAMAQELSVHRQSIAAELDRIRERAPAVVETYRDRLQERVRGLLAELDVEIDRSELIKEVSIFAERSDIAEEIVRLASHLDQFLEIMKEPESPGRKLEFLTQEMFREANTIGSKASDVQISRGVVEIKGTLEKIRELVQNVE